MKYLNQSFRPVRLSSQGDLSTMKDKTGIKRNKAALGVTLCIFQWKHGLKAAIAAKKSGLKNFEDYICKLKYKLYIFTK